MLFTGIQLANRTGASMRARRTFTSTAVALATIGFVLTSLFASSASATTGTYLHYVALGDSYTAGPLIPLQRLDPMGCFRSTENYPSLIARKLAPKTFDDVSCSGADTSNMTQSQSVLLGPNRPQFSVLDTDTDLVTIGIGGNDDSVFGRFIGTCPTFRNSDPVGNPCQRHFTVNGVDTLKAAIATTERSVATVLRGIHQRAPRAKVLLVGYPRIAPASGTCPDILPFSDGDYPWLNSIEEALNAALTRAAATDGATTYVDTYGPSAGHDACATNGAAWINGQTRNLLTAESYHPFRRGMEGVAAIVRAKL